MKILYDMLVGIWKKISTHQRIQWLDTVCRSNEGSKFVLPRYLFLDIVYTLVRALIAWMEGLSRKNPDTDGSVACWSL